MYITSLDEKPIELKSKVSLYQFLVEWQEQETHGSRLEAATPTLS
jgi:hypothetical protein